MIPALLPRLGLAALLCFPASVALAQPEQPAKQRSRTVTEPKPKPQQPQAKPAPQRGSTPGPQQKGSTGAAAAKPAAAGQAKAGAATTPGPGGGKATLLASFNDWGAYATGQGRSRTCYALSQPKERLPKDLKRDPAYLFVSFRPADNVRNEIAVVMGFATRDGPAAEAVVGSTTYALVTKGGNAWVSNPAEESQVIAAFSKGESVTVKATSGRGNATSDRYSLMGFSQALDRARKECS